MKTKILCLFLSILFILTLTACGTTPDDTTPAEMSGEFVVTGEKYVYKNKDVLLLNVENQTDKNYDVTAVVHYFDAEGNELKSQKQTFNGWASGYQNYFLFQPNITFDTFTYSLELEEFRGEACYSKYITTKFGLREIEGHPTELVNQGDFTKYSIISGECIVTNKSESALNVSGRYVVIDKNNNIYSIEAFGGKLLPKTEDFQYQELYWEKTTEKLVWPDELTGDVTAIFVVSSVKPA